jgi:hypothetical protein
VNFGYDCKGLHPVHGSRAPENAVTYHGWILASEGGKPHHPFEVTSAPWFACGNDCCMVEN